jgi:hypothetical protein
VFRPHAANHEGEVRVALADLGYQGVEAQLMMPEDTAVFDTGSRDMRFVHGGNSLQERLIPVLTIEHREKPGGSTQQYQIFAQQKQGLGDYLCLEIQVKTVEQLALAFGGRSRIELALKCPDNPDLKVELSQARGTAQVKDSVIQAPVGEAFELFFRLIGSSQEKVRVEVFHPSATDQVTSCIPDARFLVSALAGVGRRSASTTASAHASSAPSPASSATSTPALTSPSPSTQRDEPLPPPGSAAATSTATLANDDAMASWLLDLSPDEAIRRLFAHLATHGTVTELEAVAMLGSPRAARRFALQVDELASRAPFAVRVVVVVGEGKRYVKEQS